MNTRDFFIAIGGMSYYIKQINDIELRNKMLEQLRLIEESIKHNGD